jgi:hypothetical protein
MSVATDNFGLELRILDKVTVRRSIPLLFEPCQAATSRWLRATPHLSSGDGTRLTTTSPRTLKMTPTKRAYHVLFPILKKHGFWLVAGVA